MNDTQSFARRALAALAGAALVFALAAAVWGVYRRLPRDERAGTSAVARRAETTALRVRLRREGVGFPVSDQKITVQLFPINMTAARDEFDSEHRPGQRFEDFAAKLMGDRRPVSAELDDRGEAVVAVPPGKWWVHATVSGPLELTWRLPVNVTGREQTVELTQENAYTRAKTF
jgi:hypothetical protein